MRQFLVGKIRFRNYKTINLEQMNDPNKTFVLPLFFKPGRTHVMLRTSADKMVQDRLKNGENVKLKPYQNLKDGFYRFYYNCHIIPIREEKLPGCKSF